MRCHYLSDLHLESEVFRWDLPRGDCLIIAGDLCHATCFNPARKDKYHLDQRDRVLRFADHACEKFRHVLLVLGNHEHYGGVFGESVSLMRQGLTGFTILDNEAVDINGVRVFGSTLWTDFNRQSPAAMDGVRKGLGEYFFVKVRESRPDGATIERKFRPEDAAEAFSIAWRKLNETVEASGGRPLVVITHHAPSLQGLNPQHRGNGLDLAYASDLDAHIERLRAVRYWVHGHTHTQRSYCIGATKMLVNCRGFDGKDLSAWKFEPDAFFDA